MVVVIVHFGGYDQSSLSAISPSGNFLQELHIVGMLAYYSVAAESAFFVSSTNIKS